MNHPAQSSPAVEQGFTLIEVTIVALLTTILLGIFYGSTTSLSQMTVENNKESSRRSKQIDVLEKVRDELVMTGLSNRFQIAGDGGYPASVQFEDGTILTAYYANATPGHQRYHMGVIRWCADE